MRELCGLLSSAFYLSFHRTEGEPGRREASTSWDLLELRLFSSDRPCAMKGPRQPGTKVVVWPRAEGDWKPHPHVSSSQGASKQGLWGQRSERGLLDWNMRMWAGLEGRGAWGQAFRSFWEPSQWDAASGLSEALEWCVGRMLTQLSSGFWASGCCKVGRPRQMRTPLPFFRCLLAGGGSMTWNSHEMSLNATSVRSVATDHQSLKPPGPLMGGGGSQEWRPS